MTDIEILFILSGLGVVLLAGLAAAVHLARFLRARWRVAGAIVDAEAEDRRSTFAGEMNRHGIELPPSAPPVGPAAGRASVDDHTDTQVLVVHRSRHAAPESEELSGEVGLGGWTEGRC